MPVETLELEAATADAAPAAPTTTTDNTTTPGATPGTADETLAVGTALLEMLDPESRAAFQELEESTGGDGLLSDTTTTAGAGTEPPADGARTGGGDQAAKDPGAEVGPEGAQAPAGEEPTTTPSPENQDKPPAEPDPGPGPEAATAAADAAGETDAAPAPDATGSDSDTPEWVTKRFGQLTAQREAARTEAAEHKASAEALQRRVEALEARPAAAAPTPENPLADVADRAGLDAKLATARERLAWALAHPDGGQATDGQGRTVDVDAAGVARLRSDAEAVLYLHGPARERYLQAFAQATPVAREWYPETLDPTTEAGAAAAGLIEELSKPGGLRAAPDHQVLAGDMLVGMQVRAGRFKLVPATASGEGTANGNGDANGNGNGKPQGSSAAERLAHNQEAAGSNPAPATSPPAAAPAPAAQAPAPPATGGRRPAPASTGATAAGASAADRARRADAALLAAAQSGDEDALADAVMMLG